MFKNYVVTAWRTLFHNKLYSILNIAGLTFGLSCFLIIGLYLFDEFSFDRYHSKTDRIYRIVEHRKENGESFVIAGASYKLAEESKTKISGIETTSRISRLGRDNIYNADNKTNKFNETITTSDETLFNIFDFIFIDGSPHNALSEPNTIVLSEELAQRLFNSTRVAGKSVRIDFIDAPLTVTAVVKNPKNNSSFDFPYLLSESTLTGQDFYKQMASGDWSSNQFMIYALLKKDARPENITPFMDKLVSDNFKTGEKISMNYELQPLKDVRLHSAHIADGARNSNNAAIGQGSLLYVRIFAVVALFVLLIACINYMNLTTARFSSRKKEIGIRKSIGAFRKHLILQFLVESVMVTVVSFFLSLIFVNLLLPAFNRFTGKELSLDWHTEYRIWLYAVLAMVAVAALSGLYPSLMLSKFKPIMLLKGTKTSNKNGLSLRRALVVFQFTISIVLIVATIVLVMQVRYVNNKDLGFKKDQLVVVDINSATVRREAQTIVTEFSKIPGIKQVSTTSRVPGEWKIIPTVKVKTSQNAGNPLIAYLIGADENFIQTFGATLLKGRNFSSPSDSVSVILNETAAAQLHITEPSDQVVEIPERAFGGSYTPLNNNFVFRARVVGIVKDFHFQSLREKIAPMVLAYRNNPAHVIDYYTARIQSGQEAAVLKGMQDVLAKIDNNHLFEYHFLDEQLALFYAEDQRRETLLLWIAFATIFIACLGLFGLATYAAAQRIKEIGVRKVLGASITQLASLLVRDFLKLVLIANVIAIPIAWWATHKWMQEFAYHIDLKWWIYALAGLIAILIALATVSFQTLKTAAANPVKSLRTE